MTPRTIALAVALGSQRVGLATLDRENLLDYAVSDLWRAKALSQRTNTFLRSLDRRLDRYPPSHIVIVDAAKPTALTRKLRQIVEDRAQGIGAKLVGYSRAELRASALHGGGRNQQLAEHVVARYPELKSRLRFRREIPGYRGISTPHEKYHRRLFFAIAGAEQALADELLSEVVEYPKPL